MRWQEKSALFEKLALVPAKITFISSQCDTTPFTVNATKPAKSSTNCWQLKGRGGRMRAAGRSLGFWGTPSFAGELLNAELGNRRQDAAAPTHELVGLAA